MFMHEVTGIVPMLLLIDLLSDSVNQLLPIPCIHIIFGYPIVLCVHK